MNDHLCRRSCSEADKSEGFGPERCQLHSSSDSARRRGLAESEEAERRAACIRFRKQAIQGLAPLRVSINGDESRVLPHVLNVTVPGVDAEAAMVVTKDLVSLSNGSACTSNSYEPSHVLAAMGFDQQRIESSLRISWSHTTPPVDWDEVSTRLMSLVG